jgi:hypothetical protein
VAQDLIAIRYLLALELEDARCRDAGLAAQHMPGALRDECQVAGLQQDDSLLAPLELDRSGGDDVEPQVTR